MKLNIPHMIDEFYRLKKLREEEFPCREVALTPSQIKQSKATLKKWRELIRPHQRGVRKIRSFIEAPLLQAELESAIVSNYANYKDRSEEFQKLAELIEKMTCHKS